MIGWVAALWSIFQLLSAHFILLDSIVVRSIHLAFALALVYLSHGHRVLALIGSMAALYLFLDYEGISERQGAPLMRDLIAGGVLIGVVLDSARRALGPALSTIGTLFILSALFASSLPDFLAYRAVSLEHLIAKLTLSTEGIYGIPLRVSADTVFLFVLFGAMLQRAGAGEFFVNLAVTLLGRFRGGPAKAAVVASGLTGLVSGSSIANTVTTGTFTIPLMIKCGYPATKAAAIEVAASTNGQLMPPIMGAAAFIIAEYCRVPYIEVIRAAFLPAILSYLALLYITHLEACKLGLKPSDPKDLPKLWSTLQYGWHFFIPLTFLVYQLIWLRRSAALSAFHAIWALALVVILKTLYDAWKERMGIRWALKHIGSTLWESLATGGKNMMGIGVAVAAAGIIVGVVSMGLGGKVTEVIEFLSFGSLIGLLVVTAVVSLILGMGLPTTANYIVMANLTAPAIVALSGDVGLAVPLIAAHLFCFYFGILADDTPPVGLAAYAASAISGSPPLQTGIQGFLYDLRTAILPFIFILNTEYLLIGVDSLGHFLLVASTGLVAMLAFANLMHSKLPRWQQLALVVAIPCLLMPIWQARAVGALLITLVIGTSPLGRGKIEL